ncbi:MAG: CtsR family transcriptional regulator [Clostridiales bacterium]|nr:CtsR family transcriptional regulator [Clostridiales bacterium]
MSRISDIIEAFINELIEEAEGTIEFGRNDLASQFNCAPSQINYVLTTRFTSDRGYCIESRRGGGGYIKISKVDVDKNDYLKSILSKEFGDNLNKESAFRFTEVMYKEDLIDERIMNIIKSAVDDNTLSLISRPLRDRVRSEIFKAMLVSALI